ncbi:MAG: hypothetical protein JRI57_11165 [Deltaproteobacteria bacterium]|nr:hypothetical protein [Deltaproteobacteria bacterium]MBW1987849.1 hypothetical protein [Deltaproteobacteria bacterium]MBW2135845.1 hypothetical protein [Deltaproteobacteria bacterium]
MAEPVGRNTAPAIAWAARILVERDPQALMTVLPADQLMVQPQLFWEALMAGRPAAQQGYLVTFGVTPTRPESGYGYIKQGEALASGSVPGGVYQIDRFVEKPDPETAARYLAEGGYSWNSGIFFWQVDAFLQAVACWQPDLLQDLEQMHYDEQGRPSIEH